MAGLMEIYAFQLLNDKADLKGTEESMGTASVYISGVEHQKLKLSPDSGRHHGSALGTEVPRTRVVVLMHVALGVRSVQAGAAALVH